MSRYYCHGTINFSSETNIADTVSTFYIDGVGTVPAIFDTTTLPNGEYTVRVVSEKNGEKSQTSIDKRLHVDFSTAPNYVIKAGRRDGYYFEPSLDDEIIIQNNVAYFKGTKFVSNNYPPLDLYMSDEFSLTASVNPDSVTAGNYSGLKSIVVYKGSGGGIHINYGIQLLSATSVQFFTRVDGAGIGFYGFTVPNMIGRWTHLAVTVSGSNLKCYADGKLISTQTLTSYISSTTSLPEYISKSDLNNEVSIGGAISVDNDVNRETFFHGYIKNVGIYGKALTQSDIYRTMYEVSEYNSKKTIYIENIPNHNTTGGTPQMLRGVNTIQRYKLNSESRAIMASWGVKLQRIQLDIIRVNGQTFEQSWTTALNLALQEVIACQALGIKCIVDVHSSPMVTWSFTRAQMDDPLWMTRMTTIYTDICNTFLPYADTIWAYEIYNEPFEPVLGYWRKYAVQFIAIIRAIDQNVWLIYHEAPPSYRRLMQLEPFQDKRIIYSVHFYTPGDFCFQGIGRPTPLDYPSTVKSIPLDKEYVYNCLDIVKAFQDKYNVPIFVGEFSCVRYAPQDSSIRWFTDILDYFEARQWPYCYHAFTYQADPLFDMMQDVTPPPQGSVVSTGVQRTSDSEQLTLLKSYFSRGL